MNWVALEPGSHWIIPISKVELAVCPMKLVVPGAASILADNQLSAPLPIQVVPAAKQIEILAPAAPGAVVKAPADGKTAIFGMEMYVQTFAVGTLHKCKKERVGVGGSRRATEKFNPVTLVRTSNPIDVASYCNSRICGPSRVCEIMTKSLAAMEAC